MIIKKNFETQSKTKNKGNAEKTLRIPKQKYKKLPKGTKNTNYFGPSPKVSIKFNSIYQMKSRPTLAQ